MSEQQSKVLSRIIMVEPQDGPPFLVADFAIDCPFCGRQHIEIAGHHMKLIRDVLMEAIDQYPELTTSLGRRVVDRVQFKGPGNDPSTS